MKITKGIFIGKFSPLHSGHQLVIDFASQMVDILYVMVCQEEEDIYPLATRLDWMWESYAHTSKVIPCTNPNIVRVKKEDDPEQFWREWIDNCDAFGHFDYVFGGEWYCQELADRLGAKFLPVWRNGLDTMSATKFRNNPYVYWDWLAVAARPYFIKRVSFIGVESAGKSTMIKNLLPSYRATYVDEWARQYHHGTFTYEDMLYVGRGQVALENARARASMKHNVMLCDTDPLMTYVASMQFFGKADPELKKLAQEHKPYVTTFVLDGQVPYVPDGQREADKLIGSEIFPDGRILSVDLFIEALEGEFKRPYKLITGNSYTDRKYQVMNHLDPLIHY